VASDLPDISYHPLLRSLDLRFGVLVDPVDVPSWLHTLFLTIRSPNYLEEISLMITTTTYISEYVEPPSRWRDIDSLLTRPQFSRLRRVRLSFAPDPDRPIDYDRVGPRTLYDTLGQLPNLDSQGILFVHSYEGR
jgi:hypothetical protein